MKVLHVGKYYPPSAGGMESHLQTLVRALAGRADLNLEVLVANEQPGREELNDGGARITRLPVLATVSATPLCVSMAAAIRRSKAEIVHIHWPNPAAVLCYLAAGAPGKLVITYHSDVVRQKWLAKGFQPILNWALRKAAGIIVTSPQYIEGSETLRPYRAKCRVIPPGINLAGFGSAAERDVLDLRGKYGKRLVLAVGRHVYYKGFEFLLKAMTTVSGHLLLVGEGPLRADLEALAQSLGIAGRVTFLSRQSDRELAALYQACAVFVLPSVARSEAFGIVQVEAMASGKPVINTRLDSAVPWVSQDGVTGLTVAPEDPAALARVINRLLGDPALRQRLGQAGRRRAVAEFSAEAMAERTLALYRQLADSPRA